MDQVQFEESNKEFKIGARKDAQSFITRMLIRGHVAKDAHGVSGILTVFTIICFSLAGFLLWRMYGPSDGGRHAPPLPAQYPN